MIVFYEKEIYRIGKENYPICNEMSEVLLIQSPMQLLHKKDY